MTAIPHHPVDGAPIHAEIARREFFVRSFLHLEKADPGIDRSDEGAARALNMMEVLRVPIAGARKVWKMPKPSVRTLRRWLKAYEAAGCDRAALAPGPRRLRYHPEAERLVDEHARARHEGTFDSIKTAYLNLKAQIDRLNKDRAALGLSAVVSYPSMATLFARCRQLDDVGTVET